MGFGVAAFTRFASEGWWACLDSNQEPDRYERPALTIELQARATSRGATRDGADTPYNGRCRRAMAASRAFGPRCGTFCTSCHPRYARSTTPVRTPCAT